MVQSLAICYRHCHPLLTCHLACSFMIPGCTYTFSAPMYASSSVDPSPWAVPLPSLSFSQFCLLAYGLLCRPPFICLLVRYLISCTVANRYNSIPVVSTLRSSCQCVLSSPPLAEYWYRVQGTPSSSYLYCPAY